MSFTPAIKEQFTLKLAIAGIAGVGKSYTSFQIAKELANGERFAVIDSENRKSRKYADEFQFDASDLDNNFSIGTYTKEIKAAETAGYKVLVIDGLSQLWEGKGGIKEMVDMIAKRDKIPTFSAWQSGNAFIADFVKMILESPMHIICTMRSKTDYISGVNEKGKLEYKRLGLAPIQKDSLEFEFDLFAEMDHEHHIIFRKSLCKRLSGKVLPMAEPEAAKKLVNLLNTWMEGAEQVARASTPAQAPATANTRQPAPATPTSQHEPIDAQDAKRLLAHSMAKRLGLNTSTIDTMDEARLDDYIQDCKREYRQMKASEKAEAAARAEMAKEAVAATK